MSVGSKGVRTLPWVWLASVLGVAVEGSVSCFVIRAKEGWEVPKEPPVPMSE